jgi:hypothetical protein
MNSKFSGIIQINDLDDFIGPGQVSLYEYNSDFSLKAHLNDKVCILFKECVKPVKLESKSAPSSSVVTKKTTIEIDNNDGSMNQLKEVINAKYLHLEESI